MVKVPEGKCDKFELKRWNRALIEVSSNNLLKGTERSSANIFIKNCSWIPPSLLGGGKEQARGAG
jgi:hypothetical protein